MNLGRANHVPLSRGATLNRKETMSFEIEGTIEMVSDIIEISESFRKRELIVRYISHNPDYPDSVKFECVQDKVELFDGLNPGDSVTVYFNIRGRRWEKEGKLNFFTSLQPWKIEKTEGQEPAKPDDKLPF